MRRENLGLPLSELEEERVKMIGTSQTRLAPVPLQATTIPATTSPAQFDFSTIMNLMLPIMIVGAFMGMIGNMFIEGEAETTV